jgi:hypothetical protein
MVRAYAVFNATSGPCRMLSNAGYFSHDHVQALHFAMCIAL